MSLITLLTLPGLIIHEIAHRFICDILDIPVYKVQYYEISPKKLSGCVVHAPPPDCFHQFLICLAPFFINSLFCMVFTFPFIISYTFFSVSLIEGGVEYFAIIMAWIGITASLHAFPSDQDIEVLRKSHKETPSNSFLINCIVKFLLFIFRPPNDRNYFDGLSYLIVGWMYVAYLPHLLPFLVKKIIITYFI